MLHLGPRTQNVAHLLIHSLRQILAPDCLPIFTSDRLNLYFYALTAHFGQWLEVGRRGRKARQWQAAAGLMYGQLKKSYRRRKLVRVTHVMRLGARAALKAASQGLDFSGPLNTALIERVNLTVRHGVAALARRTWATTPGSPAMVASLLSFCASPRIAPAGARAAARARWQACGATLRAAHPSYGSGENQPPMDCAGSAG